MTTTHDNAAPASDRSGAIEKGSLPSMTTIEQRTDRVADQSPDMADGLRDLGEWLGTLAGVIDLMPQVQRRALLNATRHLRADLHAIRLGVPGGTR